ncbi:MAG: rhodanese-like domain-containing protein [Pseudomonadota bacterium]
MVSMIPVAELRAHLYGDGEVALMDVREMGQIAAGHILFSAPLPYSIFEVRLPELVPDLAVPLVLVDEGDGVAGRAAVRAEAMGYSDVAVLDGGVGAWAAAGYELFDGVNVPSKVFGELIEHAADTPRMPAEEVARRQAAGERMVIVDGRPLDEYRKMNIPGAVCCPNGELALRIDALAREPDTTVVVNCAGRTRSIIGAQTLIDVGIPNPVYALENGTQGWTLAGLDLEFGNDSDLAPDGPGAEARRGTARELAARHGVTTLGRDDLAAWIADTQRTLYLFDVRDATDRAADSTEIVALRDQHGVVHAPGGQLVQATDRWVGVRGARIVVLDTEGLRAPVIAAWLARLGHDVAVLEGGLAALEGLAARLVPGPSTIDPLPTLSVDELEGALATTQVIDLRSSAAFRAGHVPGSFWSSRPRVGYVAGRGLHVLIADDSVVAALAANDLRAAGIGEILLLEGGIDAWQAAGLPMDQTPMSPPDAERIDFIFHTHDRHSGNLAASQAYLDWEVGLIARLHPDERAVFRV